MTSGEWQQGARPSDSGGVHAALFRQKAAFGGVWLVAVTAGTFLMAYLRDVLEPFLWAFFLVIALDPIISGFDGLLARVGACACGFSQPRERGDRGERPARCPLSKGGEQARPAYMEFDENESNNSANENPTNDADPPRPSDGRQPRSACDRCCGYVSRSLAVVCALALVVFPCVGVATYILDGALELKSQSAVYEKGARDAFEGAQKFFGRAFGKIPKSVADELYDKMSEGLQGAVSGMAGQLLSVAGQFFVQMLMLGLYVIFWICTPLPMKVETRRIFRRYLLLKGFACLCYAVCVGVTLHLLRVELAGVFGLLSFLFSFIPEVGAFFAMALPMPVIWFDSRLESPFLTLITATAAQLILKFFFSNIVEVKLVENDKTMKMHPVVTLFAVTFFGLVWGPTGMLLSVPIMTYVKVVVISHQVPPAYRDPLLVLLEGDRRAPQRHNAQHCPPAPDDRHWHAATTGLPLGRPTRGSCASRAGGAAPPGSESAAAPASDAQRCAVRSRCAAVRLD